MVLLKVLELLERSMAHEELFQDCIVFLDSPFNFTAELAAGWLDGLLIIGTQN